MTVTDEDLGYMKREDVETEQDYIAYLENKLEQATLHPGYIASAGPEAQQAADYAAQLMKLQAAYAVVLQENARLKAALEQKIRGTW